MVEGQAVVQSVATKGMGDVTCAGTGCRQLSGMVCIGWGSVSETGR